MSIEAFWILANATKKICTPRIPTSR